MTKRPENVKCENCVFWWQFECATGMERGECRRYPPAKEPDVDTDEEVFGQWRDTEPYQWCGEFRSSWPEDAR